MNPATDIAPVNVLVNTVVAPMKLKPGPIFNSSNQIKHHRNKRPKSTVELNKDLIPTLFAAQRDAQEKNESKQLITAPKLNQKSFENVTLTANNADSFE